MLTLAPALSPGYGIDKYIAAIRHRARVLAAFMHRGEARAGHRVEMFSVGLHGRTPSAAMWMAG
ncbi:MAG: hypothetical protein NVV74_08785 [Magnetospirillum sp.]|nr:hypothetical protein [Magnetospirillum sp.]